MNGMTPELKAVFDTVCELRLEANSDIFSFKLSDVFTRLDKNKDSIKYGIGVLELKRLLNELVTQYHIQLDYVEEVELDGNHVDYRWKYGEYDWIYEDIQTSYDIRNFFGKIYINISRPQIKEINDATEKKYTAILSYKEPNFVMTYDGKQYVVPGLSYGRPFTILTYIMQNKLTDRVISRKDLSSVCNDKSLENLPLTTNVFVSNNQVKILKPFIEIKPQSILVHSCAKLSSLELQTVINACK